jgi:hypothetical protein
MHSVLRTVVLCRAGAGVVAAEDKAYAMIAVERRTVAVTAEDFRTDAVTLCREL